MGKYVFEMTKQEIELQRERSRKNYLLRKSGENKKVCACGGEITNGWKYCEKCKPYRTPKEKRNKSNYRSDWVKQMIERMK